MLVFQNASEAPVYDVEVSAQVRHRDFARNKNLYPESILKNKIIPPGKYIFLHIPENTKTTVDLKDPENDYVPSNLELSNGWTFGDYYEDSIRGKPILGSPNWKVQKITFKDAAENLWVRDDSGLHLAK